MTKFDALIRADQPYLTDGGFETWLFFQQGFEVPEFAAILLMEDDRALAAMRSYFDQFLALAESAGTGFVLDTNSWRGGVCWAEMLGKTSDELLQLSRKTVEFARDVQTAWQSRVPNILINGVIGPSGDGYDTARTVSAEEAQALHSPQIQTLAQGGVDMLSAITITNIGEAIGIVKSAKEVSVPVVISFTIETDGKLPTGDLLGEAIQAVDRATANGPAYYMLNCAHPDHLRGAVSNGEGWTARIGGLRANASRLSHEELDNAEELDEGDPEEFGLLHRELVRLLPNLRVLGGCCGTDYRHVGCVSKHIHLGNAA